MSDQQLSRRHSPDPGVYKQVLGGGGSGTACLGGRGSMEVIYTC